MSKNNFSQQEWGRAECKYLSLLDQISAQINKPVIHVSRLTRWCTACLVQSAPDAGLTGKVTDAGRLQVAGLLLHQLHDGIDTDMAIG